MRAELEKVRSLPTPRYTLVGAAGILIVAVAIAWAVDPADWDGYDIAIAIGAGLPTTIGSIVLGVWMVGVEYGQGTLRRVLTAEPRRGFVVGAKLGVALACAAALTILVWALGIGLASAAASARNVGVEAGGTVEDALAGLVGNLIVAAAAFGIALLVRSMAGAMAIALGFWFLDPALSAIPGVGDYLLGPAVVSITDPISGGEGEYGVWLGAAVATAWLLALVGGGTLRFTGGDAR